MGLLSKVKLYYLATMQTGLIFKPNAIDMQPIKNPMEYGLQETSEVSVRTEDEQNIMLWVKQPSSDKNIMFIFFHGNTGHLGDVGGPTRKDEEPYDRDYRIKLLKEMCEGGDGFIAVSHRGYGKSTGKPSEFGFLKDINAIADFVINENNSNLAIVGESLGAFSAFTLGEILTSKGVEIRSINMIAPFASIAEKVVDDHPDLKKYDLEKWIKHGLSNLEIMKKIKAKANINLLHSGDDITTGIEHSKKLLKEGKSKGLNIELHDISPSGHITWDAKKVLSIIRSDISAGN